MTLKDHRSMSDEELIEQLRKAASIWFRKEDLMAFEELLFRFRDRMHALRALSRAT